MGCQRFSVSFTAFSFIILLFSTFLISNASAQEDLFIVIYDPDTTLPIEKNIFLEEKIYLDNNNDPAQVLRNCVHPNLGLHVLNMAFKTKQKTLGDLK